MLNLWGQFEQQAKAQAEDVFIQKKKKKEIKRRKKWKIKKKKVVYFYFNRTNELLRENNINVFLHFRPVEGFDFFFKKTVKMGEYPRQKSLIKYSTKLKTTLERNENEKHFHFFFFSYGINRPLESSSVCIDLSPRFPFVVNVIGYNSYCRHFYKVYITYMYILYIDERARVKFKRTRGLAGVGYYVAWFLSPFDIYVYRGKRRLSRPVQFYIIMVYAPRII